MGDIVYTCCKDALIGKRRTLARCEQGVCAGIYRKCRRWFAFFIRTCIITFNSTNCIFFVFQYLEYNVLVWFEKTRNSLRIVALLCIIGLYYILLQPIRALEYQMDAYQWSLINDKLTFVQSIDTKYQKSLASPSGKSTHGVHERASSVQHSEHLRSRSLHTFHSGSPF